MNKSWNPFSYPARAVVKSLWGFMLPGLAILLKTLQDNGKISLTDVLVAFLTASVVGYSVFAAENDPPGAITPREAGSVGLLFVVGVVLVIVGILGLFHVLALSLAIAIVLVVVGLILLVVDRRHI